MDPILIASGLLALLGGGAGAYAWNLKRTQDLSDPDPLPLPTAGQDPDTIAQGFVNLQGGAIAQVDPSGNVVSVDAGIISPYVKPGPSVVKGYVAPAPAKGANISPVGGLLGNILKATTQAGTLISAMDAHT